MIPRYPGDVEDPRGSIRGAVPHKQRYGGPPPRKAAPDSLPPTPRDTALSALAGFVDVSQQSLSERLRSALRQAERADFVVAFVQPSGLKELQDELVDAPSRGNRIRVITGDYLGVTIASTTSANEA